MASGEEDVAYDLQTFGRAMVIGDESTVGPANLEEVRWIWRRSGSGGWLVFLV
jgi:C-terminal processing protease CtpA/Prc